MHSTILNFMLAITLKLHTSLSLYITSTLTMADPNVLCSHSSLTHAIHTDFSTKIPKAVDPGAGRVAIQQIWDTTFTQSHVSDIHSSPLVHTNGVVRIRKLLLKTRPFETSKFDQVSKSRRSLP
ncbi:hypothetical protein BDR07DRAFT_1425698 [Suillus spraguei]|nr:hypothetical protein BDR07DRAFT_1425698 [Suillus spraguei]